MVDLGLIINVILAIAIYKASIAAIEFACIRLLAILIGKQVSGRNRQERIDRAIRLADEELKKTTLN